jgi:NCS2 family nucleobase:cation symporter-2
MGATLIFSGSFIIFNGIQIIVTRLLDNRKILVIGISLILGLSNYAFPTLYAALPDYVQPLTSSPFVLAIASALVLNAVFRIGILNRASLTYDPRGEPTDVLVDFLSHQGAAWGARRDVIQRVTSALVEFSEHLREFSPEGAKATLSLAFDESSVEADVAYDGAPLLLPKQPSGAKPIADLESIPSDLCGLIISRLADRARTSTRDGRPMLHLTFLH